MLRRYSHGYKPLKQHLILLGFLPLNFDPIHGWSPKDLRTICKQQDMGFRNGRSFTVLAWLI